MYLTQLLRWPVRWGHGLYISFTPFQNAPLFLVPFFTFLFFFLPLCFLTSLFPWIFRHRSINLFLMGYQKLWIVAEEYSFEEKLVQDLAVSTGPALALPCVLCVPAGALSVTEMRQRVSARLSSSSWPVFGSAGCVRSRQALHEFGLSLRPRRAVYLSVAVVRGAGLPCDTLPLCLGVVFLFVSLVL